MGSKKDFVSGWEDTLQEIQDTLASDVNFSIKADISLRLLEVSLDALAEASLLSGASVCVDAYTTEGKHIVQQYKLGKKEGDAGKEVLYIRKSKLVEDE